MAWFGMRKDLLLALRNANAKTDEKGNFILLSSSVVPRECEGIVTGYDEDEIIIGDEIHYIDEFGKPQPVRNLMNDMPGVNGIKVF